MPNYCENYIIVEGAEKADIEAFIRAVAGPVEPFDFDKIRPTPDLLICLQDGQKTFLVDGKEVLLTLWFSRTDETGNILEERPLTKEEQATLDTLGTISAEKWAYEHWGCKWPANEVDVDRNCDNQVTYQFLTPWQPPTVLVEWLREQYPDLWIVAKFDCFEDQVAGYY